MAIPTNVARFPISRKVEHLLSEMYNYTTAGAKNGATVSCVEEYHGPLIKTTLTLTATPISVADDAGVAQYGGVKIYDFPAGLIVVEGAYMTGSCTMGATGTIIDNWTGVCALGSATAGTGSTLTSTEADFMASGLIDAGASDKIGVFSLVSTTNAVPYDGTATAADLYWNLAIADNASHTAATGTITGTVVFWWRNVGDK